MQIQLPGQTQILFCIMVPVDEWSLLFLPFKGPAGRLHSWITTWREAENVCFLGANESPSRRDFYTSLAYTRAGLVGTATPSQPPQTMGIISTMSYSSWLRNATYIWIGYCKNSKKRLAPGILVYHQASNGYLRSPTWKFQYWQTPFDEFDIIISHREVLLHIACPINRYSKRRSSPIPLLHYPFQLIYPKRS
jgi:hypothetical protein